MTESLVVLRDRRESAIARISDAYAEDLLDVDELERRLDLVHNAHTVAELDALCADLAPASTALVPVGSSAIDDPTRPRTKKLRTVLGTLSRKGRWTVPHHLTVRVLWGTCELDFRDASLGPGVTEIDVRVTMGNLEVILPPGLAVDIDVSAVLGNVEERHRVPPNPDPSMPIVRITGVVRLGNLETSTRLPGESGGDARRREKQERKALRAQNALPPG